MVGFTGLVGLNLLLFSYHDIYLDHLRLILMHPLSLASAQLCHMFYLLISSDL